MSNSITKFIKTHKVLTSIYILLGILIFIIFFIISYCLIGFSSKVVFKNNSSDEIKTVIISDSCGNQTIKKVNTNYFSEKISYSCEGSFSIIIELENKEFIKKENFGYITPGEIEENVFILTENKNIAFTQIY
jgi:hypothetical protein